MSSNGYVFTTRRQVQDRIAAEPEFAIACLTMIRERAAFMASHNVRAAKVLVRVTSNSPTVEDLAEAVLLASRYARTISRLIRQDEISGRPDLAAKAAAFGVAPATPAPPPSPQPAPETPTRPSRRPRKEWAPAPAANVGLAEKPRRRPGRPKKNAEEGAQLGRRRRRAG